MLALQGSAVRLINQALARIYGPGGKGSFVDARIKKVPDEAPFPYFKRRGWI
ncbi:MAG TPA: hypothetical protein VF776_03465 [Sphingomicrobium sp.]